jgi:DNA polymerase I-like protein with 3'-5' exonuclease and polymerase domains
VEVLVFGEYQMPLWKPPSLWKPTPVSQLPSWAGAKRIGFDLETFDPTLTTLGPGVRRDGRIVGISFAIEDGPAHYLPIGHTEDNLDPEHVWQYLEDQAKIFDGDIVGANLAYDLDYIWEKKLFFHKVKKYRDIQVAEPLIDELQLSYSLENISKRYEIPGKNEALLRDAAEVYHIDPKKGMWQLPGRFVGEYAIQDARLPLTLARRQDRKIEEQGLEKIYDLETRLLPALVRMRRRGVRIDLKHLQKVEDWSIQEQTKELAKVKELSGVRIGFDDMDKAKALAPALRMIANIKINENAKGQALVDKEFLAALKHPIADAILRAKKMSKLRGTFCASIRRHMVNGRIHSTFNQLRRSSDNEANNEDDKGARYGRLSSTDPNVQQQPARDPEIGKLWRTIYIPEDGEEWAAMDYSQQEPRMTTHYAELSGCTGASMMADAFRNDPNCDNHSTMTSIVYGVESLKRPDFKKLRGYCKEIYLGITYGMGGAKLCRKLNLPTEWMFSRKMARNIEVAGPEGKAIMNQVDTKMPYLRQLARLCEQRAKEVGKIVTLLGRVCRFPMKKDNSGYDWCHKALNRLIQGSSADQTKLAVVTMDEQGDTPQLQVHDEIDTSVPGREKAEQLADIMRHCVELRVPSKVDVELGKSWGDSMG